MKFSYSSRLPYPPEAVFALHEREDIFEILSPPWPRVTVLSREGGMEQGARVVLRISMGPFGIDWVARHTSYTRNRLFEDVQERGPFRSWRHRHLFLPIPDGCELRDEVEFSLPPGVQFLAGWLVRIQLRRMFAHRHAATARALGLT